MLIIGCDFHTRYQQIAMLDNCTGELIERRLEHEHGEARSFYRALPKPGGTYFYVTDHLGSTRLLTAYPWPNSWSGIVECDDYYPFGEQISCGGTSTTTHKFTGYERDAESGLDNAQARYNSSSLGRFMSPDPVGNFVADATNPQTWNLYAYVNNNPLAFIDPSGTDYGCNDSWDNPCSGFGGGWNLNEEWAAETSPSGSGQGGAPQMPCADDPNCTFQDTMNGAWWDTVFGPQNQNYGGATWDNYVLHTTFGGNYYNLPGYGDPVAQALEQYDKQVAQAQYNALLQQWEHDNPIAGPGPQGTPPKPLSQRLLTYFTQYVPCVASGWITYTVGDEEHTRGFFGSNFVVPPALAATGPKGAVTGIVVAAAYDLNAAANINATCTAQVYGGQQ